MKTDESRIYIIENNYLAAQYIRGLLTARSIANVRVITSSSVSAHQPIDTNRCVLLLDRPTIASALLSWGPKLRATFPNSHLIVIADREFGVRVHRMFQRWIVTVIDYANLQQLPVAVLRAMKDVPDRTQLAFRLPPSPDSGLLREAEFSRREGEILELVCLRLSNKEIARQLNVQIGTVKFHISNIFAKLGLRRRKELFSQVEALMSNTTDAA
jgi:DNA-binding NarL/FixJ family response regulator